MSIMSDGLNDYTMKDGKLVLIERKHVQMSLSVADEKLYGYDQDSGLLKLNRDKVPEGILEQITKEIEQNSQGITVQIGGLPLPPLEGVKKVEYLSSEEIIAEREENSFQEVEYSEKRTFSQKIRSYFKIK